MGYKIIGIHEGYRDLFNGKAETVDINFHYADRIFPRGGSTLRMSRYKPKDDEFSADFFEVRSHFATTSFVSPTPIRIIQT